MLQLETFLKAKSAIVSSCLVLYSEEMEMKSNNFRTKSLQISITLASVFIWCVQHTSRSADPAKTCHSTVWNVLINVTLRHQTPLSLLTTALRNDSTQYYMHFCHHLPSRALFSFFLSDCLNLSDFFTYISVIIISFLLFITIYSLF